MTDFGRGIVCVDIDGTLTRDQFSRFGGQGTFGKIVWAGLRKLGIAERMMRDAESDALAKAWLHSFRELGYRVVLLTGREERYRTVTTDWLRNQGIGYQELDLRPPRQGLLEHKLSRAKVSAGCVLYIDDTFEFCLRVAQQGGDAPLVLHCEDWRLLEPALRAFTRGWR